MINQFEKYAQVLLIKGLSLQKGQLLFVYCPLSAYEFIQVLTKVAYQLGAAHVEVNFFDPLTDQIRYQHCQKEYIEHYPEYLVNHKINMAKEKVALLKFSAGLTPSLDFDIENQKASLRGMKQALKPYLFSNQTKSFASCSTVIPTNYWASVLFPDKDETEALGSLWNKLIDIAHCNTDDPLSFWEEHIRDLSRRKDLLTNYQFKKLHIYDSKSDFTIALINHHQWVGGCEMTLDNLRCMPNFPTEEIFTACHKYGINGLVHSSKPLVYQNNIIDDFSLLFENGRIIEAKAAVGQTFLDQLINTEEASHYCGEIALLPSDTLISKTGLVFKNTLLDENAASHLAIGCAYSINYKKPLVYTEEAFAKKGLNFSSIHCDFMFGRHDTTVIGYDINNHAVPLIKQGKWQI